MLQLEDTEDVELGPNMCDYIKMYKDKEVRGFMAALSEDKKTIIPLENLSMPSSATYEEFINTLPKDKCVLAPVYLDSGESIFITWCPEGDEDLKGAMILNITKYQVRKGCDPQLNVNATIPGDVSVEEVTGQISQGRPPTAISGIFASNKFD